MDPEKQPLLSSKEYPRQRFRPLTTQEVLEYQHDETWSRARFVLIFMFWSLIALSVVIIMCLLATAPQIKVVPGVDQEATVSPVRLSLVPLVFNGKEDLTMS